MGVEGWDMVGNCVCATVLIGSKNFGGENVGKRCATSVLLERWSSIGTKSLEMGYFRLHAPPRMT